MRYQTDFGNKLFHKPSCAWCDIRQQFSEDLLRRAFRRLNHHGFTWYRGRLWPQEVLPPKQSDFPKTVTLNVPCQPPEHLPKHRLVLWHWNAGQLSPARYQELLRYLHQQNVDVALSSETHLQYSNEWSTSQWHAIHTGSDSTHSYDKASGLRILVAKHVWQAHQISWHAVVPGRILHCRLHLDCKPFDIFGVYQYPWNTLTAQRTRRQTIWKHLGSTLQAIPQGNTLCLMVDFNCSLSSIARLVGTSTFLSLGGRKAGPQPGDMLILRASSKIFQITAINSWSPQHGATFQSHAGESRIDFILTRLKDADNMAKQVGLTVTAPFLSDSSHHVPADQHFLQIFQTFQISSWCYTAGKADMSSGDDALLWLFISLQVWWIYISCCSQGCTINRWKPFPRQQCLRFFRNGGITLSSPNWSEHRPRWWWQSNSRGSNVWPMWSTNTVPNSGQNAFTWQEMMDPSWLQRKKQPCASITLLQNGMVLHLFCQLQHALVYLDESELQIHWRKSQLQNQFHTVFRRGLCGISGAFLGAMAVSSASRLVECVTTLFATGLEGCFLDHANLPPSWTTSGCWGCKNLWAKRCCNWWLLSLSNSRFLLGGWWFLSAGQYSVHASTQSQPRYSCAGGIQFCLDLTRAFDAVPRPVPAAALDRVQSNPQL